jgi:hypothetical protein
MIRAIELKVPRIVVRTKLRACEVSCIWHLRCYFEVLEKKQFRCGEGTAVAVRGPLRRGPSQPRPPQASASARLRRASSPRQSRYQLTTSTRKVRTHADKFTQAAIVNHNQFAHKANNEKTAP